jgi:hypothetical protein
VTPPPLSPWRYLFYAIGAAMIGYGVWGQVYGADTKPVRVAVLVVTAALIHDLLLAPVVMVLGMLLHRLMPHPVRPALQGAGLVAFCLVLVAIPGLGRYGARADNPSVLPRNYTEGLLLALAVVALGAAVQLVRRRR